MRVLQEAETAAVAGGEMNWGQVGLGTGLVATPVAIAGGPAVVNGTVGGVVAGGTVISSTVELAGGAGAMVTGWAPGGTVVGVGVVPVVLGGAAFAGGYLIGDAIEQHTGIGSTIGDAVGTFLGENLGWDGTFFGW